MAVFMGIHKIPADMTADQVKEGYGKYKTAATAKGLTPRHANFSMEKGFAYCETEAASAQEVRDAHADAEIPLEDVVEVVTVD